MKLRKLVPIQLTIRRLRTRASPVSILYSMVGIPIAGSDVYRLTL